MPTKTNRFDATCYILIILVHVVLLGVAIVRHSSFAI